MLTAYSQYISISYSVALNRSCNAHVCSIWTCIHASINQSVNQSAIINMYVWLYICIFIYFIVLFAHNPLTYCRLKSCNACTERRRSHMHHMSINHFHNQPASCVSHSRLQNETSFRIRIRIRSQLQLEVLLHLLAVIFWSATLWHKTIRPCRHLAHHHHYSTWSTSSRRWQPPLPHTAVYRLPGTAFTICFVFALWH